MLRVSLCFVRILCILLRVSAENIAFWKDVAAFREWCTANDSANANNDKAGIQSRAKAIADKYVRTSAASQVNLRSDVMEAVLKEVDSDQATPTVFNSAQQEIFNLLERDSFPRFKASPLFVAMMEEYGVTVVVKKPGEGL
jgi:regulator of G-protein signaling